MDQFVQIIHEILGFPAFLINQCLFLPVYVREALISSIVFIPWLYFLYYAIELLERFFMVNINLLIKFVQRFGPIFGVTISVIPECGYQVLASTFYSRRMISKGTLLAFYISCSDDALPLLFMDFSKAGVIIPLIIIKMIVGVIVAFVIDFIELFINRHKVKEKINAINTDYMEYGCCNHSLTSIKNPPFWWTHPASHTFNMFMFTFFSLVVINSAIHGMGSAENLATLLQINSPVQVVAVAAFGIISNCVISVFIALAYVKGIISFPALLAGMISVTGLGLMTLAKRNEANKTENKTIVIILFIVAVVVGLGIYYNPQVLDIINNYFIRRG